MRLNINTSDVCIADTLNLNWNNNYNTTSLFRDGGKAIRLSKKGSKQKIKIKESNKGLFTQYCGGNVTAECIKKGKNSPDPKIRKRATFAANSRTWNRK